MRQIFEISFFVLRPSLEDMPRPTYSRVIYRQTQHFDCQLSGDLLNLGAPHDKSPSFPGLNSCHTVRSERLYRQDERHQLKVPSHMQEALWFGGRKIGLPPETLGPASKDQTQPGGVKPDFLSDHQN